MPRNLSETNSFEQRRFYREDVVEMIEKDSILKI
jgi:hypothetical protein